MFSKDGSNLTLLQELRLKLPQIDFYTGLTNCAGDEDFYLEIMQYFVDLPIKTQLEKYYKNGDYKNYCIKIHGFKNNAYTVGAMALRELAFEMENMSRNELTEEILEKQSEFFKQYDSLCLVYREIISRRKGE